MLQRLAILLLLLPAPALAQLVRGEVRDSVTGERLAAVSVTLLDRDGHLLASALSDADGRFDMPLRQELGLRLRFDRMGYRPRTSEPLRASPGDVLGLHVGLVPSAVPLDSITALARGTLNQNVAEFYERAARNRRLGVGKIWTRADLVGERRISHVLRTVPQRAGCKRTETFVDGMPTSMMPASALAAAVLPTGRALVQELAGVTVAPSPAEVDPSANVVDWLLPPEDLEGIEVYRDTEIPTQFNPEGLLCQVTLVWRKSPVRPVPVDFRRARGAMAVVAIGLLIGLGLAAFR